MTRHTAIIACTIAFCCGFAAAVVVRNGQCDTAPVPQPAPTTAAWRIRAVDTMKESRDLAREKSGDASYDRHIDAQMAAIAATGATHVAIATPYDPEFVPFLRRWVAAARAHDLHVWFRGNMAGWEGWFGYDRITSTQHTALVTAFIHDNPDLFHDGDAFSACPECENGGPGDPRTTRDVDGYRAFLVSEHDAVAAAFTAIGRNIRTDLWPMNADVARLVMDSTTTAALGGTVTLDHYVTDPQRLAADVAAIAAASRGRVVLGEFGAPIPDLHGNMTPDQQHTWLAAALTALRDVPTLDGVSYWTATGGTTALWNDDLTPRPAVAALTAAYATNNTPR